MNKVEKSCKNCRCLPSCIDPCDDCINMDVVDADGNLLPGKEYCPYEQHSEECERICASTCRSFTPKLRGRDVLVETWIKSMS
jgi:hypothetical protein